MTVLNSKKQLFNRQHFARAIAVLLCLSLTFTSVDLAFAQEALPSEADLPAEQSGSDSGSATDANGNQDVGPDLSQNPPEQMASDPVDPAGDLESMIGDSLDQPGSDTAQDQTRAEARLFEQGQELLKSSSTAQLAEDLENISKLAVNDIFTDDTDEGMSVTYRVTGTTLSTGQNTVQVGSGSRDRTIDRDYAGIVTIPSVVHHQGVDYTVTALGDNAFYTDLINANYSYRISQLNLPSTITRYGSYALRGLYSINSFTVPATVTSMGVGVFQNNRAQSISFASGSTLTSIPDETFAGSLISSITIPQNVTYIGINAFAQTLLTTVNIPPDVTEIGDGAFSASALHSISVPAKVTRLGSNVFSSCAQLASVEFAPGTNLSTIPVGAFRDCAVLRGINLPASIMTIDNSAFENSGLLAATIADGVTYLGSRAFAQCKQLAQVTFAANNKMLNIAPSLFVECVSLNNLTLPKTINSIGEAAFQNCTSLTSAVIPANVQKIGDSAYLDCSNLTTLTFLGDASKISTATSTFYLCDKLQTVIYRDKKARSLNLPSSQPTYYYTINYYESQVALQTPGAQPSQIFIAKANSVPQSINAADVYQGYLPSPPDSNSKWVYEDGFGITSEMTNSFYAYARSKDGDLRVGQTFTALTMEQVRVTYTVLALPNDAQNLPGYAAVQNGFLPVIDPNTLGSVTIPQQVTGPDSSRYTVSQITAQAFKGCTDFVGVTIPATVTYIGANAFQDCTNLRNVSFLSDASKIMDVGMFSGCAKITTVIFGGKKANLSFGTSNPSVYYTVVYYQSKHDLTIGNKQSTVVVKARSILEPLSPSDIRSGNVPDLSIGYKWTYEDGFSGSEALTDSCYVYAEGFGFQVNITVRGNTPSTMPCWFKVTSFDQNTNQGTVQVGVDIDGLTAIHSSAKGVPVIPATVQDADGNNYTVSSVGSYAFGASISMVSCIYITSAEFPSTVKAIGASAFTNCQALSSIEIPAAVSTIGDGAFQSCNKLTTVRFDANSQLATLPARVFLNCLTLSNVVFPQQLTGIGSQAFSGCIALSSLFLPASLRSIAANAFSGCVKLTALELPVAIHEIGASAFSGCRAVRSMSFLGNASKVTFGSSAFNFGVDGQLSQVIFRDKKSATVGDYITSGSAMKFDPKGNEYGRFYYIYYTINFYENIATFNANRPNKVYQVREDHIPGLESAPFIRAGYAWYIEPGYLLTNPAVDSFYAYGGADISQATVSGLQDEYRNNGSYLKPVPILTMPDGTVLRLGIDYSLDTTKGDNRDGYASNRRGPVAKVYMVGINDFAGKKDASFKIVGLDYTLTARFADQSSFTYSGKANTPAVQVYHSFRGTSEPEPLVQGVDYTVQYLNNIDANSKRLGQPAKVLITEIVTQAGITPNTTSLSFDIYPYPLSNCLVDGSVELTDDSDVPVSHLTVTHDVLQRALAVGEDYTITFRQDADSKNVTTYLSGIGNYSGLIQLRTGAVSSGDGGGAGGGSGSGFGSGNGSGVGSGSGTGIAGSGTGGMAGVGSANTAKGPSEESASTTTEGSADPGLSGGGGGNGGNYAIYKLSGAAVPLETIQSVVADSGFQLLVGICLLLLLFAGATYRLTNFRLALGTKLKSLKGQVSALALLLLVFFSLTWMLPGGLAIANANQAISVADDPVVLTINSKQGVNGRPVQVAAYTAAELDSMVDISAANPTAVLAFNTQSDNRWRVYASAKAITLDKLLSNANASFVAGDTLTIDTKDSQSFSGLTYSYDELAVNKGKFYPATGVNTQDTDGGQTVLPCLALSSGSVAVSSTALQAANQALSVSDPNELHQMRFLLGASEADYLSQDVRGMRLPYDVVSINIIKPYKILAGTNRFETAAEVALEAYPQGTAGLILTAGSGDNSHDGKYADALAASTLAGLLDYPILLTQIDSLPAATSAAISTLEAQKVIILGDTNSVSSGIEDQLKSSGLSVERIFGTNRIQTAVELYKYEMLTKPSNVAKTAIFTQATNYPDALAIAPYAAYSRTPIFFVEGDSLSDDVLSVFNPDSFTDAIILGDPSSVSVAVENQIAKIIANKPTRLGGVDRYETARLIAQYGAEHGLHYQGAGIASGEKFPDALVAGPLLAQNQTVALLTTDSKYTALNLLYENQGEISRIHIFGDQLSVSQNVRTAIENRLSWGSGTIF